MRPACVAVPRAVGREELRQFKGDLLQVFKNLDKDPKAAGVSVLGAGEQVAAETLINSLADYGIFVVPVGALENWLQELNLSASKANWIEAILTRLGSDPNDKEYVRPGKSDVWAFVRRIATWIIDTERKGMPSNVSLSSNYRPIHPDEWAFNGHRGG